MVQMQTNSNVYSDLNGKEGQNISPDDVNILLDLYVRILKPPSPQPANRQINILQKYIRLLNKHRKFTDKSPISLSWIQPFVDTKMIETFPGLGLAFPNSNSLSDKTSGFSIMQFSEDHPVFPSSGLHLHVWNELLECTKRQIHSSFPISALFCNQHTENRTKTLLPTQEPFIVRLRLQNPFPFPLILKNLHLSLNKLVKNGTIQPNPYENVDLSVQNLLELPGISNETMDWHSDELAQTSLQTYPTPSKQIIDLWVLPRHEVESFEVNGIQFNLCIPQLEGNSNIEENTIENTLNAFVPIEVKGRRLFGTKEQRMSKKYSEDNRLHATVQSRPSPLLSFRPIGGDADLIQASTQNLLIESNADQILQIVFEVENVGKVPVNRMSICANYPEQVSINEPKLVTTSDQWSTCPVQICQSTFANEPFPLEPEIEGTARLGIFHCKFIGADRPLDVGQRTGIRIAIRAWPEPQFAGQNNQFQQFYFLFLYSGDNGQCRQFRYALRIRCTQSLMSTTIRQLNPSIGLFHMNLGLTSSLPQNYAIKLELLRISAIFCERINENKDTNNDGKMMQPRNQQEAQQRGEENVKIYWKSGCTLNALINKPVIIENDQSMSLCFLASPTTQQQSESNDDEIKWDELWLNQPRIPDIPIWRLALSKPHGIATNEMDGKNANELANSTGAVLLLKLLWKASIAQKETATTIFGETLLSADE